MPLETETTPLPEIGEAPAGNASREQPNALASDRLALKWEAAAVLAVGIVFFLGVAFEVSPLNGSVDLTSWKWPWRNDIELLRSIAFLFVPFLMIEIVLRKAEERAPTRPWMSIAVLTGANFLLQIMAMFAEPDGFGLLRRIVESPLATSYYSDATRIAAVATWLRNFDHATLAFHSATHPPGPVLFYYLFFRLFGAPLAAVIGGCTVGLLGSLGVAVAYAFAGLWTGDEREKLTVCALYALLPAITVFFPEFDQAYPILSMLLIFYWCRSLESGRAGLRAAVGFGCVLLVTLFFAYNLLAVGVFLAAYAVHWLRKKAWSRASAITVLQSAGAACGICAAGYALLWLGAGYHPAGAFRRALAAQRLNAAMWDRSYVASIFCDPYDFLLGAGFLSLPLIVFYFYRGARKLGAAGEGFTLSVIGLFTILIVDLSGVLRGEASRVWLFLQPLLIVPAALELARFRGRWRTALFAMQWLILACLKARMLFIRPWT